MVFLRRFNLVELANIVADAAEKCGYKKPEINLEEDDTVLWAGMDSTKFMHRTGWMPTVSLEESVMQMMKS